MLTESLSELLVIKEYSKAYSVAAGSVSNLFADAPTLSGYTVIGILGFNIGNQYMRAVIISKTKFQIFNPNTSNGSGTATIMYLYVKD